MGVWPVHPRSCLLRTVHVIACAAALTEQNRCSQGNKTERKIYEAWRKIRYKYKGFVARRDLEGGQRGEERGLILLFD